MPRAGWKKPESDRRLSDLVSVGVLTRVFPPELVDEVIAGAGRTEQRHRIWEGASAGTREIPCVAADFPAPSPVRFPAVAAIIVGL